MNLRSFVLTSILFVLTACVPETAEVTSALTRDQATAIAVHALTEGFNEGSYQAWSRDWSVSMRAAIGEEAFQAFRGQALERYGAYRSIREARLVPGRQPGIVRWEFLCEFERGDVMLAFGFRSDGVKVEGAFLEEAEAER